MAQIRRSFSFLDGSMFKKLCITFVRPHLEYAVAVWAPQIHKYNRKWIDGFNQLDYSERLRRLDIPTLIYRRARGDMIEIFKHFHSYDKKLYPTRSNRATVFHEHILSNSTKEDQRTVCEAFSQTFYISAARKFGTNYKKMS